VGTKAQFLPVRQAGFSPLKKSKRPLQNGFWQESSTPAGNFVPQQPVGYEDVKFSRRKKFEARIHSAKVS